MAIVGAAHQVGIGEEHHKTEQEKQRHQQRETMMTMRYQRRSQYKLTHQHKTCHIEADFQREKAKTVYIHLEGVDGDIFRHRRNEEHNTGQYLKYRSSYAQ